MVVAVKSLEDHSNWIKTKYSIINSIKYEVLVLELFLNFLLLLLHISWKSLKIENTINLNVTLN